MFKITSLDNTFIPAFTCPHCKQSAEILELESCSVINKVIGITPVGWEEETEIVIDADISRGSDIVWRDGLYESFWICSRCREEIDDTIKTEADLFNWLRERKLLIDNDGTI